MGRSDRWWIQAGYSIAIHIFQSEKCVLISMWCVTVKSLFYVENDGDIELHCTVNVVYFWDADV